MTHSMLWERLQVFLTSLDTTPPTTATQTVINVAAAAVVDAQPSKSRMHALEHALLTANASLSDERARRAKWERRALVSTAEQNSQREALNVAEGELREMVRRAEKFEALAEESMRARRVAEEQRDVALGRLAQVVDVTELEEVKRENCVLEERVRLVEMERERFGRENLQLKTEMQEFREAVSVERERFVVELAERTSNFADLERELRDARETYIVAADKFEEQRRALGQRLTAVERERDEAASGLKMAQQIAQEKDVRIAHLMQRCHMLELENAQVKTSGEMKDNMGSPRDVRDMAKESEDMNVLREKLAEVEAERDALKMQLKMEDRAERLSSSSVSSEAGDTVAKRVQELELSLEVEAKEAETLRMQLENVKAAAKAREDEACQLRGEMAAIHSRMRSMARVSIPSGAEHLLEEDEDANRLKQVREKRGLGITAATLNRIQRKGRLSGENKIRFR